MCADAEPNHTNQETVAAQDIHDSPNRTCCMDSAQENVIMGSESEASHTAHSAAHMIVTARTAVNEVEQNEDARFWWSYADTDQPHTNAFGAHTAQIVDEDSGGAVAYVHHDNADRIVNALNALYPVAD